MPKAVSSGKKGGSANFKAGGGLSDNISLRNVSILPSSIHGEGVFAEQEIRKNYLIDEGSLVKVGKSGIADNDYTRSLILAKMNHSVRPNTILKKGKNGFDIYAKQTIRKGKELTIDYKDIEKKTKIPNSLTVSNTSVEAEAYNLDKFESGKNTHLYITGYSGSGKTTLASQLSKKYRLPHIQSDDLFEQELRKIVPSAELTQQGVWRNIPKSVQFKASQNVQKRIKELQKQRAIIEGIDIPQIVRSEASKKGWGINDRTKNLSVVITIVFSRSKRRGCKTLLGVTFFLVSFL